jgi:hypothetical protein
VLLVRMARDESRANSSLGADADRDCLGLLSVSGTRCHLTRLEHRLHLATSLSPISPIAESALIASQTLFEFASESTAPQRVTTPPPPVPTEARELERGEARACSVVVPCRWPNCLFQAAYTSSLRPHALVAEGLIHCSLRPHALVAEGLIH